MPEIQTIPDKPRHPFILTAESRDGVPILFVRVYATDLADAVTEAELLLNKPGHEAVLLRWTSTGRQILTALEYANKYPRIEAPYKRRANKERKTRNAK